MLKKRKTNARLRRKRMAFERLEHRDLCAIINWVNRGTPTNDTDGFNGLFKGNANLARGVVDAAIESWQNVIASFNYSNPQQLDTFSLTVSANATGVGLGANAGPTRVLNGKPTAGNCGIGRGIDTNPVPDGIGDGAGWFLDPTPQEHSEFLDQITNAFSGLAPASGGPASNLADLYTILLHEFGHALGITDGANYLLQSSGLLTPIIAGNPPAAVNDPIGTPGKLWLFDGPSIRHLMTSFDTGGATGSPVDSGFGDHSAFANTSINVNGTIFTGANDLMNPSFALGERRLIPQTMALILQDAYGYTIRNPADWPERPVANSGVGAYGMNFYAMLSRSSGQLLIRGGAGNDIITVSSNGTTNLTVSVDLGLDVAGTGALPGAGDLPPFRMVFPTLAPITNILILAGDGNDVIRIEELPKPVRVDGGIGDDQLILGWQSIPNLDTFRSHVSFDGQFGTDTLTIDDSANLQANRSYTLSDSGAFSGRVRLDTQSLNFDYASVNFVNLRSGAGPLSIANVRGTSAGVTTTIEGAARVIVGSGDVSNVLGRVQIVNPTRATALTINDSLRNDLSQYDINPTNLRVIHGSLQTVVSFTNATLSSLTINGSRSQNEFNLRGTRASNSTFRVTLNTGPSNDVVNVGSTSTAVAINGQGGFDTINLGVSGVTRTGGLMTIANTSGLSTVNVFDTDFTGQRAGILYRNASTGNTILSGISGDISMQGRDISSLNVRLGRGGNTFRIHDTPNSLVLGGSNTSIFTGTGNDSVLVTGTTGRLAIEGQNGADSVTLGKDGIYQGVKGKVVITNELGTTGVRVDNSADDATPRTMILYKNPADGLNVLSGLNGADLVMRGNDLRSLAVTLGDGGNTLRIHDTPVSTKTPGLNTLIKTGGGGDLVAINGTSGGLTLESNGGLNEIKVGSTTDGLDRIQAGVTLRGAGGIANVTVQDQTTTPERRLTHIVNPTNYTRDGVATIQFSSLGRLSILAGGAADTFDLAGLAGVTLPHRVIIDGGGQVNTLDYSRVQPAGAPGDPPTDQVSLYLAENDFADAAGANEGTPRNGVSFATGRQGQAFRFDGVDDYIDLGNDASLNLTQSATFSTWVYIDERLTYKYLIADFDPSGTRSQGSLGILGEHLFWFQTLADGTSVQPEGSATLVPGQWYHVAGVRDDVAKTITLYVNGMADGVTNYVGEVVPLQGNKLLGTSLPFNFPNDFFQGRMDDVAIFNRALSATEIMNLYGPGPAPGIVVNLALGVATGVLSGVRNIQNVVGGGGNDILIGVGGNQLFGGGGIDLIVGGATASVLNGGQVGTS